MPKAPEPSSTCQKTTKSLPRISPKSYRYNSVPNRFSSHFSTFLTNALRLLSRAKVGTHSTFRERSHTTAHTPKQGAFRMEVVSLPSERSTCFGNPAWPDVRTANFAAFGSWSGVLSKNAESLRDSDAHDARRCSEGVAAPLGCVICLQFGDVAVFSLCAQYFLNVRGRGVLLPSACFTCC